MKKPIVLLLIITVFFSCSEEPKNIKLNGSVFGTSYNIQYLDKDTNNYQKQIDSLFDEVNESMSTYIPTSKISRINKGENVEVDHHFKTVFRAAKYIYRKTEGAFDPTIGAVVNAWDFGPEGAIEKVDSTAIDSLMKHVGFNRMGLKNNRIVKNNSSYLDLNAIAKGYGVDVIGKFFESKHIENYLVEIGGEIKTKGINAEKNLSWTIGIDDPNFNGEQSYSKILALKDEAMATSGTYRKFKTDEEGNRYAHIIDTKTGYPTKTNILSVSVIAEDCITADGYATAFQTMGIEKVEDFLNRHPELKVYFIYEDNDNVVKTLNLNDFPD